MHPETTEGHHVGSVPSGHPAPSRRRLSGRLGSLLAAFSLLLASFAGATPAAAEQSFTFTGGGWGHGVGMSQYGACGMASAGRNYAQILTHYYSGTQISGVREPANLRVLLADSNAFTLDTAGTTTISGVPGSVGNGARITVRRSGNKAVLSGAVNRTLSLPVTVNQGGAMRISPPGHRFDRGRLVIRSTPGSASRLRAVIEGLTTRDYLLGIAEVSTSWPMEALKTQATAARTVAKVKAASGAGSDHDLKGYLDGAYLGYEVRARSNSTNWSRWAAAIDATAGKVVTYGGRPIQNAVYSSSSGGRTENNETVWGGGDSRSAVPYLRGVADPNDNGCGNPRNRWTKTFTASQLGAKLGTRAVRSISVNGHIGGSGRTDAATITFTDSSGAKRSFTGAQLRSRLGLYSTKFTIGGATQTGPGRPPSGSIADIRAHEGRNILVAGRASDPDGTPRVFVADQVNGRTRWHVFNSAGGHFLAAFPVEAGEHTTCVAVLDTPSGAATNLGCRQTVVK